MFYSAVTIYNFIYTPCLQKNCAKLFLPELYQISTNFDNFGRKMAKRLKLWEVHSFSTSPNSRHVYVCVVLPPSSCTLYNLFVVYTRYVSSREKCSQHLLNDSGREITCRANCFVYKRSLFWLVLLLSRSLCRPAWLVYGYSRPSVPLFFVRLQRGVV